MAEGPREETVDIMKHDIGLGEHAGENISTEPTMQGLHTHLRPEKVWVA